MQTDAAGPADANVKAPRFSRLRTIALFTALLFVVCGGAAIVSLWWKYGVDHTRASSTCASCAVDQFLAAGPTGGLTENKSRFDESTCAEQRSSLFQQMQTVAADVDRATSGTPWSLSRTEVASSTTSGNTVMANVWFIFSRSGTVDTLSTDAGSWTFTMSRSDGWKVCGLQAPQLCGTLLNCSHPSPAPGAPSESPTGLLSNLDPLARCGPKDPFRQYHDCPSPSPSASQ